MTPQLPLNLFQTGANQRPAEVNAEIIDFLRQEIPP